MKKFSRILGFAGLVLLAIGALGYAIASIFPGFYVIPWFLAGMFFIVFLVFNRTEVKQFLRSRSARYGAGSFVTTFLFLGIVIFVCALTSNHKYQYDFTPDQRHSLAPQTLNILNNLDADVEVIAFLQGEGSILTPGREILERFARVSNHITYRIVDPDRNPMEAQRYEITRYGTVVVNSGENSEKISNLSEERLTNAILRVTRRDRKVVYFLTGHEEKDLEDQGNSGYARIGAKLKEQNYEIKPLVLLEEDAVPENAALVVVAGPKKDLLENETTAIEKYMKNGGNLLFMIDPHTVPGMRDFLLKFGVLLGNDVVVDKESRAFGFDYSAPLIQRYTQHPIMRDFSAFSVFPMTRSVSVAGDKPEGFSIVPLAMTGEHAWAETDIEQLLRKGTAKFDKESDQKGNISVVVVGTMKPEKTDKETLPPPTDTPPKENKGKFVVIGDSDFAANAYLGIVGNEDFFFSVVNWLAEESDLVAVRAKETQNQPLMLTSIQGRLIFWIPVGFIPLSVLIVGAMVLASRRRS